MSLFGNLATETVDNELGITGSSRAGAISSASGWYSANMGILNTRLFTSFSGETGVSSNLKQEEQDIYKRMYLVHYWKRQATNILANATADVMDWIALREADTSITRMNRNEMAKTYRGFARDEQEELDKLIHEYLRYQSSPRQVGVLNYESGICQ